MYYLIFPAILLSQNKATTGKPFFYKSTLVNGHPNFRNSKSIFLSLNHGDGQIKDIANKLMLKCS